MKNILNEKQENNRGITLIALIITIIVLLILAGISIASLTGDNGILNKSVGAQKESLKNQYQEEIKIIIMDEIARRKTEEVDELFIVSLDEKIREKDWVKEIYKYDENENEQESFETSTHLLVETKDDFRILVEVNEENLIAKITRIEEGVEEKYSITYHPNEAEGKEETIRVKRGDTITLKECTYQKENCKFIGWCKNKNGEGDKYLQDTPYKPEGNEILYAIWLPKVYLYDMGKVHSDIQDISQITYSSSYAQGTFEKLANGLSIRKNTTQDRHWSSLYIASTEKFDFSNYTKLCYSYSSMQLQTSGVASNTR